MCTRGFTHDIALKPKPLRFQSSDRKFTMPHDLLKKKLQGTSNIHFTVIHLNLVRSQHSNRVKHHPNQPQTHVSISSHFLFLIWAGRSITPHVTTQQPSTEVKTEFPPALITYCNTGWRRTISIQQFAEQPPQNPKATI
jgi:hypothetical protein